MKEKGKVKRSRVLLLTIYVALGVVSVYACFYLWLFFGWQIRDWMNRTSFDSTVWRENAGVFSEFNDRQRMVNDLLDRYELLGLPSDSLDRLLGPSDNSDLGDWDRVYFLGPERGWISIDDEWLSIRLDSDIVVTEVNIISD